MSAAQNVIAALGHLPARDRAARAEALLSLVHLEGLEDRPPHRLSGGQQQRVAVARALAREPEALLLDEPFSAVDRATRQRLYLEIADLKRRLAMPVVLVTHDLQEASMLADHLVVLHRGRTLQSGPPMEVMSRPGSVDVARLVDMKNLFPSRVEAQAPAEGRTLLRWGGHLIEARHQPAFAQGDAVVWATRTANVILHRRDRPSRGERENPVFGQIVSFVPLGETVSISMAVDGVGGDHPLHLSVSTHVARRNGLEQGVRIGASLLADGIQLMPAE
jgi:molybdate transport system ATP-binding protein